MPLQRENPRTNVDFLSKRGKSERLCVGFGLKGAERDTARRARRTGAQTHTPRPAR